MAALTGEGSSDFLIGSKTTRMSTVLNFRRFVNDRLAAAAREIFGVFEQTVAELEKELERQQKAQAVETAVLRNTSDVQQLLVNPDQVPHGQQDLNFSLDQVKEERPHRREDEQKFPFNILVVKVGDERAAKLPVESEHGTRPSPLLQKQGELYSSQAIPTVLDGVCEEPEPASNLNGDSPLHTEYSTDDSKDWLEMQVLESVGEKRNHPGDKSLTCSRCGRAFSFQEALAEHRTTCSGKNLFCSFCGQGFTRREELRSHVICHTRDMPNSCLEPTASFSPTGSSVANCSGKKTVLLLRMWEVVHTGGSPEPPQENSHRGNTIRLLRMWSTIQAER
ncbi:uncharacterized protein ACB058_015415 [Synchiropus picturatus]